MVEHAAQRIPSSRRDLHTLVVINDERFDVGRQDRCLRAVGALSMTTEADEVRVDITVASFGLVYHQSRPALLAEHAAFEVVVVLLRAITGRVVRGEHGLHLVPDFRLDDPFVGTVVTDPAVDDVPFVVGILQHPMH
nr:hypothetical protein [Neomicrococcus lactis]